MKTRFMVQKVVIEEHATWEEIVYQKIAEFDSEFECWHYICGLSEYEKGFGVSIVQIHK